MKLNKKTRLIIAAAAVSSAMFGAGLTAWHNRAPNDRQAACLDRISSHHEINGVFNGFNDVEKLTGNAERSDFYRRMKTINSEIILSLGTTCPPSNSFESNTGSLVQNLSDYQDNGVMDLSGLARLPEQEQMDKEELQRERQ